MAFCRGLTNVFWRCLSCQDTCAARWFRALLLFNVVKIFILRPDRAANPLNASVPWFVSKCDRYEWVFEAG